MSKNDFINNTDFLNLIINETENIVFVKDSEFRIVFANQAFLKLFPPNVRDKIIGTTTWEKFSKEEQEGFLKEDRKALNGEYTEIIEVVTDYKKVPHNFLTKKTGFEFNGERLMLGIGIDVQKMIDQEEKLIEANAFLEKFLSIAAHDLRSPLSTIVTCIDLIELDRSNLLSESSKQILFDMKHCTVSLMNQVTSLVDLNKESKAYLNNAVDLNEIFSQVRFNLSHLIKRHNVKLLCNVLPTININRAHFSHIIQNLIENSIKYRSSKPPLIVLKSYEDEDCYRFEIEDNGIGISQDSNVFKLFSQEDTSHKGGGLGLSLCVKIINLYCGDIWVDSDFTDGAKVCFTLPKSILENKKSTQI